VLTEGLSVTDTDIRRATRALRDGHVDTSASPLDPDELMRAGLPLAYHLAGRFQGHGQPLDDLRQVASVGLVKAARRFDPGRDIAFRTYATAVIIGELKRYFRDTAWSMHVPRPVQEVFLAVRTARETLSHALGRSPTIAELAKEVSASEEAVIEALQAGDTFYLQSLDAPADPDSPATHRDLAIIDEGFRQCEDRSWLVPALAALPERERMIIGLRFFEGMSQSQIAAKLGISQMHVSRLLSRTLAQLRTAARAGAGC
jgi:RNA polymerase sigma-B factor